MLKFLDTYILKLGELMSVDIEELYPPNPVLLIDDKELFLSPLTLQIEVKIIAEYGSVTKLYELFETKPEEIFRVVWHFIIDKQKFNFSREVFDDHIHNAKDGLPIIAKNIAVAFNFAVTNSQPLVKNLKRQKEIAAVLNGGDTPKKACYASQYDTIAKRYGYTLDQFYGLTLRQLHMLLKVINDKSYEELEVQAALAGKKLQPRIFFDEVSEEQEAENTDHATDALRRLREEYEAKKAKKGNK